METSETTAARDCPVPAFDDLSSDRYEHILLDFDHTLLLDNSTERFLDSLRPRLAAFLFAAAGDWIVRTLAWFGFCRYNEQRDFIRVLICTLLMPWNHFLWPAAARRLARNSMNRALLDALPPDRPPIVLSFGFRHIINPILDAAGLGGATLVCSRTAPRFENLRSLGKLAALAKYAPDCNLQRTLFITDSHDDDAVAEVVARAHIISWRPYAPSAFEGYYVPMRYTVDGKYANTRYFTYQILQEDFALLLLAYSFSVPYALALWFLFLSLYAIYEIGYYENDHLAAAHEIKPTVSDEARRFHDHPRFKPWIWALISGFIGVVFSYQAYLGIFSYATALPCWLAALACVRLSFFIFNRLAPNNRVFIFPLMHVLKTFSFMLLIPLTLIGALLLAAQVASISINYAIYRFGGNLERFNRQLWRMLLFLLFSLGAVMVVSPNLDTPGYMRFGLIILWGSIRAVEAAQHKNMARIIGECVRNGMLPFKKH